MQERSRYQNDVIFSALSGLLFFWKLVQHSMKKNNYDRSEEEKNFVNTWCMVGNTVLILWLLFFLFIWIKEITNSSLSWFFAQLFGSLTLTIIIISLPIIIIWKNVQFHQLQQTEEEKFDMITAFIPIISSYQLFSNKEHSNMKRLKEWQLRLLLIWLTLFFFNNYMIWIIIIGLMILRILLAFFWKDILSFQQREKISHRFSFYPEEFFSALFVLVKEGNALARGKNEVSVEEMVKYQKSYWKEWSVRTRLLTIICWWSILALLCRYRRKIKMYRKIIPISRIILRYLILLVTKTKIPKLPIIAEITA